MGGHSDVAADSPMDGRRVTRASASRPLADTCSIKPGTNAAEEPHRMAVKWPEGGAITVEWVHSLGTALDFATRNLQPSELPTIVPVSVCDSLILAAHKVSDGSLPCPLVGLFLDTGCLGRQGNVARMIVAF